MNFEVHLKNGETHEVALPHAAKAFKAIVWVLKDRDNKDGEAVNFLALPDEVDHIDEIIGS